MLGSYNSEQEAPSMIETIQDFYNRMLEYYDELFPLNQEAIAFINSLRDSQNLSPSTTETKPMCRYLGIGSATGTLELKLTSMQYDVTAIDRNAKMIDTSQRRLKRGISTARFFEMSTVEMRRFLKEGSFNIIGCLENTLPYITDETLLRKFFYDVKSLLSSEGLFVLELINFDNPQHSSFSSLPEKSSLRVSLSRTLKDSMGGLKELDAELELGNGKILKLAPGTKLNPLKKRNIEALAQEAGFTKYEFYSDYQKTEWNPQSERTIVILKA